MDNIRELAMKKILGFPIVAWAAVLLIGGYLIVKYMGTGTTATDAAAGDDTTGATGDSTTTSQPVFIIDKTADTTTDDTSTTSTSSTATNTYWSTEAIGWLVAQGADQGEAQTAITNFLNGDPLTYAQGLLRNKAVAQYGQPPEGVGAVSTVGSAPASRQGTPPCKHTVKGSNDDNVSELCRIYYGRTDSATKLFLMAHNTTLPTVATEKYAPGTVVSIPVYKTSHYFTARHKGQTLAEVAKLNPPVSQSELLALNPGVSWPVKIGKRVRVQ